MRSLKEQVLFAINGGCTKRFHTEATIKENTVGQHSYGVAWLCYYLSDGIPSPSLLMAALAHDVAEQVAGDLPAPVKRALSEDFRKEYNTYEEEILEDYLIAFTDCLSEKEKRILKMADCMDGLMFCIRERTLGNWAIHSALDNFKAYITSMKPVGIEKEIFNFLHED